MQSLSRKRMGRPPLPLDDSFWNDVAVGDPRDCWIWLKSCASGYGQLARGGRRFKAHRVAYELTYGPIPDGLSVLHKCDNPPCCNPSHLFLGTAQENRADCVAKGRQAFGLQNGMYTKPEARQIGERNRWAKLTTRQVREIRSTYAARTTTLSAMADQYGVKKCTIWKIVHGLSWKETGDG